MALNENGEAMPSIGVDDPRHPEYVPPRAERAEARPDTDERTAEVVKANDAAWGAIFAPKE